MLRTHEASWEGGVSSDFSVDLHKLLHANHLHLLEVQSVSETVSEDQRERQAFAELVWALGWARSLITTIYMHAVLYTRCELTKIPSIFPSIQCFGAFKRLRCFFGPRACQNHTNTG